MLITLRKKTAQIALAIALTALMAGAPAFISSVDAAGGGQSGGGTIISG